MFGKHLQVVQDFIAQYAHTTQPSLLKCTQITAAATVAVAGAAAMAMVTFQPKWPCLLELDEVNKGQSNLMTGSDIRIAFDAYYSNQRIWMAARARAHHYYINQKRTHINHIAILINMHLLLRNGVQLGRSIIATYRHMRSWAIEGMMQ